MCPPADIALWTDEQVIMYLHGIGHEIPLPNNVNEDLNPYLEKPSTLPGGIWYLVRSTEKLKTEFGLWRETGAALVILTGSAIRGRRTTLEFIEFQDAQEQKTNWMMYEYTITERGLCTTSKDKESRSLCRVFLSDGLSSNIGMHPNSKEGVIASVALVAQSTDDTPEQDSRSVSLVNLGADGNELQSEADKLLDPRTREISELQYLYDGNYLELNDLADPLSSSSDNASCSRLTSDEYFDSNALLQELEDKDNQGLQDKDLNSKSSVTESVQPFESMPGGKEMASAGLNKFLVACLYRLLIA